MGKTWGGMIVVASIEHQSSQVFLPQCSLHSGHSLTHEGCLNLKDSGQTLKSVSAGRSCRADPDYPYEFLEQAPLLSYLGLFHAIRTVVS